MENAAAGGAASITVAPYEHPLVWEFVGKERYLQAAICKSITHIYTAKFGTFTTKKLSNFAAAGAFIGLLEWCKGVGCCWDESVFESGASGGSVDVLGMLVDKECPIQKDATICTAAAMGGHVEALMFLALRGCLGNEDTFWLAAERGHLNVIQFAHRFRCDWNIYGVGRAAARGGHLHILQWMHETFPIDGLFNEDTCEYAVFSARIEVIKWLRSVGCAWNAETCFAAIYEGHFDILRYAMSEGCPWTIHDKPISYGGSPGIVLSAENGYPDLLEFFIASGVDLNATDDYGRTALANSAGGYQTESVKRLIKAGADVNTVDDGGATPLSDAIFYGHHEIAEILRAAGARE